MGCRAKLLDVVEVAAVNDREHSEQPLEDRHRRFLKVLRIRRICHDNKNNTQAHEHTHMSICDVHFCLVSWPVNHF